MTHPQRGAALITALLLLVVLTILGISVMQMSRVQEKMAGNTRDINVGFETAEGALRNAEALIRVQPGLHSGELSAASTTHSRKSWFQVLNGWN